MVIILLSAFAASAYAQYWLSTTPYHTIPYHHTTNQSISHELVLEQPTLIAAP
jgi:hypothetical protein